VVDVDARPLNWRFVVPSTPERVLLLGPAGIAPGGSGPVSAVEPTRDAAALREALDGAPYGAIAASDLDGWARLNGAASPRAFLQRLAEAVTPDGWLYLTVPNKLYPRRPAARGSMTLAGCTRALEAAGFADLETYVLLPDEQAPAYLVSTGDRFALDHFLRRLFLPYVPGDGWKSRTERRALAGMQRLALHAPHGMRVALAPGYGIVARKAVR
jgi:hypothetical protein